MATNASFDWADPLALDAQLTADERAIRDAAQAYWNTCALGTYDLMGKLDLNKLRVIKYGAMNIK